MPQAEKSPSPFDLDAVVAAWRHEAAKLVANAATIDELEDHLREQYFELYAAERPADEAWMTAVASLGNLQRLGHEFAKLQPLATIDRLVLTSVLGIVAILAAYAVWFAASLPEANLLTSRNAPINSVLLRTHVAAITLGYGSGLLAMIAAAYATLRSLFARRAIDAIHAATVRVVRVAATVAIVMVVLGFVLGGIWSNREWGRTFTSSPREFGGLLVALGFTAETAACTWRPRVALPLALVGGGLVLAAWFGFAAFDAGYPAMFTAFGIGGVATSAFMAGLSLQAFDRAEAAE